jgi:hypothetical protein
LELGLSEHKSVNDAVQIKRLWHKLQSEGK